MSKEKTNRHPRNVRLNKLQENNNGVLNLSGYLDDVDTLEVDIEDDVEAELDVEILKENQLLITFI